MKDIELIAPVASKGTEQIFGKRKQGLSGLLTCPLVRTL